MKPESKQYLWGPVLVLLVTLGATAAVVWQLERMADAEDAVRFETYVSATTASLDDRIDAYLSFLRETAALFAGDRKPTEAQFRGQVAKLDLSLQYPAYQSPGQSAELHYPGILGVGWIAREPHATREFPSASVTSGGPPGLVLGAGRVARLGFVFIEPLEWKKQVEAGNEMFTDARSREAMERARDSGRPALSGKATVIREFWSKKRAGFHIFYPVYGGTGVPASVTARRDALRGFVQLSVQTDEMFMAVHAGEAGRQVDLTVYDGNQTAPDAVLFRSDLFRPGWDAGYRPRFATSVVADLPGRNWGLQFATRPEFEQASERTVAPTVGWIGALLSLLLAGINLAQRRAAAALNASEVRYRRLFEASPDGVFLFDAESGRVTDVNPYMAELLEQRREELLERSLWNIGLFPDEAAGRAALEEIREKNYRRYDRLPIVTPSGKRHDVEFTCNSYMSGRRRVMQCNVRNITDRLRAEDALRESEERYRSLLEIIPQGVWLMAADGSVVFVNQFWMAYAGMSAEASERDWMRPIHPEQREREVAAWAQARAAGAPYESEVRMLRAADGQYRWHLVRGVPVHDADGEVRKWLCMLTDINERKQAEQQRARQLQGEHALRTQAEAANRAKDEFLATLSHELRTPLNSILGWAQTLTQGDADPPTLRRALSQIEASANAQARLVNDLLNVADIGSGRMRLDVKPLDLAPLIGAIVDSLRPAMAARELAFECSMGSGATHLSGDASRIQQIVWNLLSNAVKFTQHGGRIALRLERKGGDIEISVTDDGEGIDPAFLPFVFDRFRQADASIKRKHGGLGLGLAIVRHLVELHGGTVAAASAGEGSGSRFTVLLPVVAHSGLEDAPSARIDTATSPPTALAPAHARARRRLAGLRILSVDDDPNTREMLQEALERAGAEVRSAASAQEALDVVHSFKPNVVVSDIGLPEQDGYDMMRKLRQRDAAAGGATPAVALTGYAREQDQKAAVAAGYQEFVAKPVNLEELVSAILRAAHPERRSVAANDEG